MNTIIEIKIRKDQLARAQSKYNKTPEKYKKEGLNSKSYRSGNFLLHSILSEIIVSEFLGRFALIKNTKDYDIIHNSDKIDVKTKPNSDQAPKPSWNASIPAYQLEAQKCDGYVFTRVNRDLTKMWIVGIISKNDFKIGAKHAKAGSLDGNWKWEVDSYYIKIEELQPLSLYKEEKYTLKS